MSSLVSLAKKIVKRSRRNKKLKRDFWSEIGGVENFHSAVELLGEDKRFLQKQNGGNYNYHDVNSIWGRLASCMKIKEGNSENFRKWLYTIWTINRREVRTSFEATYCFDVNPVSTPDIHTTMNDNEQVRDFILSISVTLNYIF